MIRPGGVLQDGHRTTPRRAGWPRQPAPRDCAYRDSFFTNRFRFMALV